MQREIRFAGRVLIAGTIMLMIGAMSAVYFRQTPPTDPLQQLRLIAGDPIGWTAQAILFPIAMAIIAIGFGLAGARLPAGLAQRLGIAAACLAVIACLLWIPISVARIQLGSAAAGMLETTAANDPQLNISGNTFWPYTVAALLSIALMGMALALGGRLRKMGWVLAVLALVCLGVVVPLWRDWPPFMSYLFTLAMAIGLMRFRDQS